MCSASRAALLLAAWLAALQVAAGCMCMVSHPQEQFCHADFVILTRVKKEIVTDRERVYRTVVKRIFKASEKDAVSVSAGKVWTALHDSMCGVRLQPNTTYVLAGRLLAGKARVGLCDLHLPWADATPKQRKGFRLMYRQSCHCKVAMGRHGKPVDSDRCLWETSLLHHDGADCQAEHAICMRQPGVPGGVGAHCGWTGGSRYRQCMEDAAPEIVPSQPEIVHQPEMLPQPEVIPAPDPQRRHNRLPRRV